MKKQTKPVDVPHGWKKLGIHPLAEITPFGVGIDLEAIIKDMRDNGYDERYPITLIGNLIADGRHRHHCAIEAGVTPIFERYTGDAPERFVMEKMLRQHLTPSQLAMFAAGIANLTHGGGIRPKGSKDPLGTEAVAQRLNISPISVKRAKHIEKHGTESLKDAVHAGKLSVTDAERIVDASPAEQDAAVKAVEEGKAKTASAAILDMNIRCRPHRMVKNPPANCKDCHALRLARAKANQTAGDAAEGPLPIKRKRKKSGGLLFDWREYDKHLGHVVRGPDKVVHAYPKEKKSKEHLRVDDLTEQLVTVWNGWKKKITGAKA